MSLKMIFLVYVCTICTHVCHGKYMEVRRQLQHCVLSFHHVGYGAQTQVVRLSGRHLYPLSSVASWLPFGILRLRDLLTFNMKRERSTVHKTSGLSISIVFFILMISIQLVPCFNFSTCQLVISLPSVIIIDFYKQYPLSRGHFCPFA